MSDCVNIKFNGSLQDPSLRKITEVQFRVTSSSRLVMKYVQSTFSARTSGITFTVGDDPTPVSVLNLPYASSETTVDIKNISGNGYIFINKTDIFRIQSPSLLLDFDFSQFSGGRLATVWLNNGDIPLNMSLMPPSLQSMGYYGGGYNVDFSHCTSLSTLSLYTVEVDLLDLAVGQISNGRDSATIQSYTDIRWSKAKFNGVPLPIDYYTLYWEKQGNNHVVSVKQKDAAEPLYTVTI